MTCGLCLSSSVMSQACTGGARNDRLHVMLLSPVGIYWDASNTEYCAVCGTVAASLPSIAPAEALKLAIWSRDWDVCEW